MSLVKVTMSRGPEISFCRLSVYVQSIVQPTVDKGALTWPKLLTLLNEIFT